jgi:hypothetical protein
VPAAPEPGLCALCRRQPVDPANRPFCSSRCRLLDLARWAGGGYRIAGESVRPEPADPDADRDA